MFGGGSAVLTGIFHIFFQSPSGQKPDISLKEVSIYLYYIPTNVTLHSYSVISHTVVHNYSSIVTCVSGAGTLPGLVSY